MSASFFSANGEPDLSLVLACYNEGPILEPNVRRILSILDATRFSCELIFVDDASTDRTRAVIEEVGRRHDGRVPIRAIFHERNVGRGGSVRDGFLKARGTVVGYIDVDLEIQPHYIPTCVLAIRDGCDVVVGKRVYKFKWRSLGRYLMSTGYAWMVRRLLRLKGVTDTESGYKFFQREKVLPLLAQCRDTGWFWDTEIMTLCQLAGLRIAEIPCLLVRRFDKTSSVKPLRDTVDYIVKLAQFRRRLPALRLECIRHDSHR